MDLGAICRDLQGEQPFKLLHGGADDLLQVRAILGTSTGTGIGGRGRAAD